MNIEHIHPKLNSHSYRVCNSVWDIMKFKVKKNFPAILFDKLNSPWSFFGEKLRANLENSYPALQQLSCRDSIFQAIYIQRKTKTVSSLF